MSALSKRLVKSIPTRRAAVATAFTMPLLTLPAAANDFTAEKVMKEMSSQQQSAYVAGVVEGLAVARYMKDGKQKAGMECIYDWFYEDKATVSAIMDAFDKYPSLPPGAILDAMSKLKCGE